MKKLLKPLFALGMVAALTGCAGEKMISADYITFQGAVQGIHNYFYNDLTTSEINKTQISMFGDNKATSDDSSMIQHLEESFEIDLKAQAIKMHMEATEEIHDKTIGDQKESVIFDQWTAYIPETGLVSIYMAEGSNYYTPMMSEEQITEAAKANNVTNETVINETLASIFLSMAEEPILGTGIAEIILSKSTEEEFFSSALDSIDSDFIKDRKLKVGNCKASFEAKFDQPMHNYAKEQFDGEVAGYIKGEFESWHINYLDAEMKMEGRRFNDDALNYFEGVEEVTAHIKFAQKADLSKKPDISKMLCATPSLS